MGCEHKQIKSVNCELFCLECGAKLLDDYFLTGKQETAQEAKKSAKTVKKKAKTMKAD